MSQDDLAALAPLADPIRRRLYEFVVRQRDDVDRDGAAAGVGIGRPLAAFHLDRLVSGGLLEAVFRRRSGRTGPGAGRPAKFYRRARDREVAVSLPARRYDTVAEVLAEAVETSADARQEALSTARARGAEIAAQLPAEVGRDEEALVGVLADRGYEPVVEDDGVVRLRNCPFDRLSASHRELTCSLNLAMLSSLSARFDRAGLAPAAAPREGSCCVAFVPAD
jgi:predicted ArsR family transcriptional regulator